MVAKPSNMIPLGTKAYNFKLLDVTSDEFTTLKEIQSDIGTVIMFIRNHCPYVEHIVERILDLARDYIPKGISFVAINSNDPKMYPDDTLEEMKKFSEKHDFPFPYLDDPTQEAAKGFGAACTPDFFVFDKDLKCVYRGQFDESRPDNNHPTTGENLAEALDCLLSNKKVPIDQHPSVGCRIKWRESDS
ncbi:MAG: thioredoxin family protein [Simkaniaceae bacterium]|nr:MAG: thioredoxin family protein [Simkaniaceae bacterium]